MSPGMSPNPNLNPNTMGTYDSLRPSALGTAFGSQEEAASLHRGTPTPFESLPIEEKIQWMKDAIDSQYQRIRCQQETINKLQAAFVRHSHNDRGSATITKDAGEELYG